jgi:Family of unknown function (DUF6084)
MPDLDFDIEGVHTVLFAATPMVSFGLRVKNTRVGEKIHTVALRCQIQIEVAKRKYTPEEQENLRDLFAEPERWSQTLRNLLWMHVSRVVPAFTGETTVEMQVPCSFDFNVGATKYFYGLREGEIPLIFQFSGTMFYENGEGGLSVAPISWQKEAKFRLPVKTWRETMEIYYPNSAWLCLRRDIFDRLYQYKVRNGIPTWEQALENVLSSVEETVGS